MKLLLVDEEHELQAALTLKLESAGFQVLVSRNGLEALDRVKSEAVGMVIIDPELRDMNGIKLGALIRESTGTPILFFTGGGSGEDYQKAAAAVGAVTILSKRSHPDDLVAQIQLSITNAEEYDKSLRSNQRLVERLAEDSRREMLIGAYMTIWGQNASYVKKKLNRFARSKRISLADLARVYENYSENRSRVNEEYRQKLSEIEPEVISDLAEFHIDGGIKKTNGTGHPPGEPFVVATNP